MEQAIKQAMDKELDNWNKKTGLRLYDGKYEPLNDDPVYAFTFQSGPLDIDTVLAHALKFDTDTEVVDHACYIANNPHYDKLIHTKGTIFYIFKGDFSYARYETPLSTANEGYDELANRICDMLDAMLFNIRDDLYDKLCLFIKDSKKKGEYL